MFEDLFDTNGSSMTNVKTVNCLRERYIKLLENTGRLKGVNKPNAKYMNKSLRAQRITLCEDDCTIRQVK